MLKVWVRPGVIAAALTGIALLLHPFGPWGKYIWPPSTELPVPTLGEYPFLAVLALVEAAAFGAGVAFFLFGYPFVIRYIDKGWRALCVHFAISWQLVSWWFHDNLHIHIGMNINGVIFIDYMFHVTVILSAILMAFVLNSPRLSRTSSSHNNDPSTTYAIGDRGGK